jgi:hypothetical protein
MVLPGGLVPESYDLFSSPVWAISPSDRAVDPYMVEGGS